MPPEIAGPVPLYEALVWPAVMMAAALAVAVFVLGPLIWKWARTTKQLPAPASAPVPPHEAALAHLEQLERADGNSGMALAILRTYAEARFGIRAAAADGNELAERVCSAARLTRLQSDLLTQAIAECERLAFSGTAPPSAAVAACRAFVDATRMEVVGSTGSLLFEVKG